MPVYRLLSAKNQQRADTIDQPDENSSESS